VTYFSLSAASGLTKSFGGWAGELA